MTHIAEGLLKANGLLKAEDLLKVAFRPRSVLEMVADVQAMV